VLHYTEPHWRIFSCWRSAYQNIKLLCASKCLFYFIFEKKAEAPSFIKEKIRYYNIDITEKLNPGNKPGDNEDKRTGHHEPPPETSTQRKNKRIAHPLGSRPPKN
jgi:hypothetical protein